LEHSKAGVLVYGNQFYLDLSQLWKKKEFLPKEVKYSILYLKKEGFYIFL